MQSNILIIVIISVLGPIIGSFIGVIKHPSRKFMYNMLAFAGGVMLAISFLNLIPESIELSSVLICVLGIITGSIIMYIIDRLIPHIHPGLCCSESGQDYQLKKSAAFLLIGIFLHNFPEGMAIAVGSVSNVKVSIAIALAIAIHNIPEGICTSAPYFHISKKRLKSFLISSLTAIPILVGFLVASFLYNYISNALIGFIIGATAGLMIYITSDELIPNACGKPKESHATIFFLITGILFVILLGVL